jgi:hypothetical protein
MKRTAFAILATSLSLGLLLALGSLAVADKDIVLGQYPNATSVTLSVHENQGRVFLQKSTYETNDPPNVVAAWYAARYHLEPDSELVIPGQCEAWARVDASIMFRQTVIVSICVAGRGSRVNFDRTLYLAP